MNDGFSFDSSITCFKLFRVSWVNLGYIAGDRRQNLKPKFAQVPEQNDFTYGVYLVAATFNWIHDKITSGDDLFRTSYP